MLRVLYQPVVQGHQGKGKDECLVIGEQGAALGTKDAICRQVPGGEVLRVIGDHAQ